MSTNAYLAKKALFDYLKAQVALADYQVSYAWPGNAETICIYGGGIRFDQNDATGYANLVRWENAECSLYIRVLARPATSVEETDAQAAEIGETLGELLRADPTLGGRVKSASISGGAGDYNQPDDETVSILSYRITIGGFLQ